MTCRIIGFHSQLLVRDSMNIYSVNTAMKKKQTNKNE